MRQDGITSRHLIDSRRQRSPGHEILARPSRQPVRFILETGEDIIAGRPVTIPLKSVTSAQYSSNSPSSIIDAEPMRLSGGGLKVSSATKLRCSIVQVL